MQQQGGPQQTNVMAMQQQQPQQQQPQQAMMQPQHFNQQPGEFQEKRKTIAALFQQTKCFCQSQDYLLRPNMVNIVVLSSSMLFYYNLYKPRLTETKLTYGEYGETNRRWQFPDAASAAAAASAAGQRHGHAAAGRSPDEQRGRRALVLPAAAAAAAAAAATGRRHADGPSQPVRPRSAHGRQRSAAAAAGATAAAPANAGPAAAATATAAARPQQLPSAVQLKGRMAFFLLRDDFQYNVSFTNYLFRKTWFSFYCQCGMEKETFVTHQFRGFI